MALSVKDYIKDPKKIYARSFELVRESTKLEHFPDDVAEIVVRIVHACGLPAIADDVMFTPKVAQKAASALGAGMPILADCGMVAAGISRRFLPADNPILMTLYDDDVNARAKDLGTTRSAAAIDNWQSHIEGAVVAIGNAPTALFHLLERLNQGWPRPAAILGFPVGFVGAAESKEALAELKDVEFLTLQGRCGGSAMASAAVNAIALKALEGKHELD